MRHDTLPSKVIRAVSIDRPRKMWRINWLIVSRLLLLQFPPLEGMTNKVKEKEKKKKRLSIYLSSNGRHEVSDAKFLIVQAIKEPPSVGNATPSQVVFI